VWLCGGYGVSMPYMLGRFMHVCMVVWVRELLVARYGVRAYLALPIVAAQAMCDGRGRIVGPAICPTAPVKEGGEGGLACVLYTRTSYVQPIHVEPVVDTHTHTHTHDTHTWHTHMTHTHTHDTHTHTWHAQNVPPAPQSDRSTDYCSCLCRI